MLTLKDARPARVMDLPSFLRAIKTEGRGRWPLISPCGAVLLATCAAGGCCALGGARWHLPVRASWH